MAIPGFPWRGVGDLVKGSGDLRWGIGGRFGVAEDPLGVYFGKVKCTFWGEVSLFIISL